MVFIKIPYYIRVQTAIAASQNIIHLVNGYGVGWTAPIIPKLRDQAQTPLPYVITETDATWVACVLFFGCFGAYLSSYLSNLIGRKLCLSIAAIVFIIAYGILTAAQSLELIYVGRLLVGVSMSWSSVASCIYIGEIASPNIRGTILTSMVVCHEMGALLVYCVGPFLSYTSVGCVAIALVAVFMVTNLFIPESPVYHVIKGNEEAAKDVLLYLGRSKDLNMQIKTMTENIAQCKAEHVRREIFTVKSNRKALSIAIPLYFFQQSSGIIAVVFFATTIFKKAGSSIRPDIATMVVGATLIFGAAVSSVFIDNYGRKILLMVSATGTSICMAVLGVYFYLDVVDHQKIMNLGWLPLVSLMGALLSYSVGLATVPHVLPGEMFSAKVRGVGNSIAVIAAFSSGLISTTAFGYLVVALGSHVTFWMFAAVNALAVIFVIVFVPETKGKSLTEIEAMLAS